MLKRNLNPLFQLSQSEGRYCRDYNSFRSDERPMFQLSQSEGRYCRFTTVF